MSIFKKAQLKCRRILRNIKDFIVYDCYWPVRDLYYNLKWFFHNLWVFRKQMWGFRDWDYRYCSELFAFSLGRLVLCIENGNEERRSANKKIAIIRELAHEFNRDVEQEIDDHMTEQNIPISQFMSLYHIELDYQCDKIARLLRGQIGKEADKEYQACVDKWKEEHDGKEPNPDERYDIWVEWFNGTGYDGWWD